MLSSEGGQGAMHEPVQQPFEMFGVVIKTFENKEYYEQERKMLIKVQGHDHVAKLLGYCDEKKALVLERYSEDLFDITSAKKGSSEEDARRWFKQVTSALKRMFEDKKMIHLDLKLANIMIDFKRDDLKRNAKLIDFGYACNLDDDLLQSGTSTRFGTTGYFSPEMQNRQKTLCQITEKSDVFSLGVTIFTTVYGAPPFEAATQGDVWWKLWQKDWQNDSKTCWEAFKKCKPTTKKFQNLIEKMLHPNPKERPSYAEILKHPWFKLTKERGLKHTEV